MFEVYIGMIAFGALFCLAGLVVGYLGILSSVFPEKVRTREVGTVITSDLWKLRICRFRRGRTEGEPVLLVHGLGTNHHNFCEPANGCLVDYLVEKGYDCWVLDLRGTRSSEAPFERDPMAVSLDDFLTKDVPAAIEHVRRATGYAKVHYVGHSLGGMLLYAYVQDTGGDGIASATTLGAPIGFDGVKAKAGLVLLPLIKRYPHFCADLFKGLLPFIAPVRVNVGIFPMNARNVHPALRVADFYNMIDIPIPSVITEIAAILRTKSWKMRGGKLDVKAGLAQMRVPLLAIYGARDPFTPREKAQQFFNNLPISDKRLLLCSRENGCKHDYGHCDLAFGVDGARAVFKPIAEWVSEHPIRERIALSPDIDAHLLTPLDGEVRAEMLSGDVYAKTAKDSAAPAHDEAPPAVFLEETSDFLRERQAALQGFALRVAPSRGEGSGSAVLKPPARRAHDVAPVEAKKVAAPKAAPKSPAGAKVPEKVAKAVPSKSRAEEPAKPVVAARPKAAAPKAAPAKVPAAPAAKAVAPKPAPAKSAPAKAKTVEAKPVAAKAAPAKKAPVESAKPTVAKPAVSKPVAAKAAPKAPAKPVAKPVTKPAVAKAAPAAAKAAPAKSKATPVKATPAKPAAKTAVKAKAGTLAVLKAASEELAKLDKKK